MWTKTYVRVHWNNECEEESKIREQVKYGQADPPSYRIERVSAPTLLFSGIADTLSTPDDNDKVASLLGDAVIHNEERPLIPLLRESDQKNLVVE